MKPRLLLLPALLLAPDHGAAEPLTIPRQPGPPRRQVIHCGHTPTASVTLAHDGQHLLLTWAVTDSSPLRNRGQDPLHHFKEGDAVDLHLGPWRENPAQPVAGDLRLLLVPLAPPVALLYRQVEPQATAADRVEFSSPVRRVTFDSVRPAVGVEVEFDKTDEGYTCRARVPFAALGIAYQPGLRLRGDVGVLLSNDGGLVTATRCNLRQLGLAIQMYWDDYNGRLNALNGVPNWGDPDFEKAWGYVLLPYIKSTKTYTDIGRPPWMPELSLDYYLNMLPFYRMAGSPGPGSYPVDQRAPVNPTAFILLSEDLELGPPQEIDPTNEMADKTGFGTGASTYPPYHLGASNFLFADGHVTAFARFEADQMTYWPHTNANWQSTVP